MKFLQLLRYELSKLLRQRFAKAAILLTVLLAVSSSIYSTGLFYELTHPQIVSDTYYALPRCKANIFYHYSEVYSPEYFAKIEAERNRLMEEKQRLSEEALQMPGKYGLTLGMDYTLFSDLYAQCIRMQNVTAQRNAIAESARSIMASEQDTYLQNRAALAVRAYSSPLYLKTYYDEGLACYVENDLFFGRKSYIQHILILAICFLCAGTFSAEHECNIYGMLYAAKNGRTPLFAAKHLSCYGMTVSLAVLCRLVGLLVYAIRYSGIYGFSSSIQLLSLQFSDLSLCPFTLSSLQFLLICFGMQMLFYLLMTQMTLLLSIATKNTMAAFIGSALIHIGSAELFFWIKSSAGSELLQLLERLQLVLPAALLFPECYFTQMNTIRIGDTAVYRLSILLAVCCLLFCLLLTASHIIYTKSFSRIYRKQRWSRT